MGLGRERSLTWGLVKGLRLNIPIPCCPASLGTSLTTFLGDQSWGFVEDGVEIKREKIIFKLCFLPLCSSPKAGVIHITFSHLTDGPHGVQSVEALELRPHSWEPWPLRVRLGWASVRSAADPRPGGCQSPTNSGPAWKRLTGPSLSFGPQRGPWQRPLVDPACLTEMG